MRGRKPQNVGLPPILRVVRRLRVREVVFTPDGKRLVSAGGDNQIIIWNLDTSAALVTLEEYRSSIYGLEFTPDGRFLLSSSHSGKVIIRDGGGRGKIEGHWVDGDSRRLGSRKAATG